MAEWRFQGRIPGSKSVFNRALIVQSYFPELTLHGFSECDDVRFMRSGLEQLRQGLPVNCGEGGTTFRFLALRAARLKGRHILQAKPRLLQRPQQGLLDLLSQLGVRVDVLATEWHLHSEGWKPSAALRVNAAESSQYASALALNSWLLDFDLEFELHGEKLSESYFRLTTDMLQSLGMTVQKTAQGYRIPAGQALRKKEWTVEIDMSSAFTMAAAGAIAGTAVIENFSAESTQPDKVFLDIFKNMGVDFSLEKERLTVRQSQVKAVDWNLAQSPDLFPVLAVLCSSAAGTSRLYGAPHLVGKESNRIAKVSELLTLTGVKHEALPDGMVIHGNPSLPPVSGITFYPDKDHRMVMAAVLMKLRGHQITVLEPESINKSFPEFWDMIGIKP